MATINFIGNLVEAEGANTRLSIAGTDHFQYSHTFNGNFNVALQLTQGVTYFIMVSVVSDGTLSFNINGNYSSITPNVPASLKNNTISFRLTV